MAACTTCPHACNLAEGELGACRSRRAARDGAAVSPEGYGRITSLALDPIEKKPLARFMPGTGVLSVGSYGCNMNCPFCQNASIAQVDAQHVAWQTAVPADVVAEAVALGPARCAGIAYTYNEPLINWEFLRDTAKLAHEASLVNVIVSNGMACPAVLDELGIVRCRDGAGDTPASRPLVDAANIDLKCFTEEGYRSLGGDLRTVKRTIERLAATPGCHMEVTTLVVPGFSDDEAQIDAAARWLAQLDPAIPYHLTRFFPQHRMRTMPPTPVATLRRLADVASRHLDDVLLGNV